MGSFRHLRQLLLKPLNYIFLRPQPSIHVCNLGFVYMYMYQLHCQRQRIMQIRLLINFVHAGIKDQPRYHENIQFWVKINCISHSNVCSFSVDMWETNPQQTNLTSFWYTVYCVKWWPRYFENIKHGNIVLLESFDWLASTLETYSKSGTINIM